MSVSVAIPSPSLRRDPSSEPLLDSGYRRGNEETGVSSKAAPLKKKYAINTMKCFGVELSPDNIAVAMVYFVQGVLGLSRIAVNFYLKDDLHLDPAETAIISGVSSLPWLVKPLYGFIRRSYLVLSGLLGALSWSLMATFVASKYGVAFGILLGLLSVAFSDVKGLVANHKLCWGSAFGSIVSSYFSGSLVGTYGVRFVFGLTALLPLITSAVAVLVKEQPIISISSTNKLGFTPEFLGRVKLVTSVASLLRVGLYNGYLKTARLRKIFLATTVVGSTLGMTQVVFVTGLNRRFGISDEWFSIGDSLILTVLGQASFMPVLVLAAKLCPEGVEATLFATLLGGLMGDYSASFLKI
ncbi:hypothetical protein SASPL_103831 [Salvia splendens]|uniref:Uncharacterized protein n=1 Tax=Salvia splendens TaxID=180675 RepID=A0A8X8YLP6_SALSN|nr:hypothetical protein SASPL_103831 [Salvia splendens]